MYWVLRQEIFYTSQLIIFYTGNKPERNPVMPTAHCPSSPHHSHICVLNCCMPSSSQLGELLRLYLLWAVARFSDFMKIKNKFLIKKTKSSRLYFTWNSSKQGGLSLEFGMISFLSVGTRECFLPWWWEWVWWGDWSDKYYLVSLLAQISGQNHWYLDLEKNIN